MEPQTSPPSEHAFGALESLTRSLAVDLGRNGIRVVCVRTMGMAETRVMQRTYELAGKAMGAPAEKVEEFITTKALLGRSPTLDDTAKLITFLASDDARAITWRHCELLMRADPRLKRVSLARQRACSPDGIGNPCTDTVQLVDSKLSIET